MLSKSAFGILPALAGVASAASFPPVPTGLTIINSTMFPGVSISYKQTSICETTENVRGFSGYVHLPPAPTEQRPYSSHTYFWFFEARKDAQNAPLSVWLQGGPGVPSITAAVGENGPCSILPDSQTTQLNPWSWNNRVNMLYIDQPVQTGFSYDTLVNGTLDEIKSPFIYTPNNFSTSGIPATNLTFLTGTFASMDPGAAPNTTIAASKIMYNVMQAWMQEFPEYSNNDNKFSIWGESYDGHYAPVFADYFESRADKLESGEIKNTAEIPLHVDTLGFINPCIDTDTQVASYPHFAFNNTYNIQAITEPQYSFALSSTPACKTLSDACVALSSSKDPNGLGNDPDVNKACSEAYAFCFATMHDNYTSTRSLFDITSTPRYPKSFPPVWAAGYLNNATIQQALGVPLNFTGGSALIMQSFTQTGDFIRGGHQRHTLATLLDKGIKIALVFGDRDYQCNWLGGEALSLAIESKSQSRFAQAGYAPIHTNASYVGGFVRQHGNLSFVRVFDAGHEVPYYQPETSLEIFNRVMFGKDVATGMVDVCGKYSTEGAQTAWTESEVHNDERKVGCYVWDIMETCTAEEVELLKSGEAVTRDFVLVGKRVDGREVLF
ncbi:alpha/beta-hydrolase, partial [Periconia macrospinosa]